METGERLAAYVAGELDADETRALEAELARDPGMRARVQAIRETDALLADLPAVEPSPDFSARLRDVVSTELRSTLADDGDELAARRRSRTAGLVGWQKAAIAAAVVAIGGVALANVLPSSFGGADDGAEVADEGASIEAMAAPEPQSGPTVVSAGRSFDPEDLKTLAQDDRFDEVLARGLDEQAASAVAREHEEALAGDTSAASTESAESAPADDSAGATSNTETALAPPAADLFGLRTVGDVNEAELEDVRRCLPQLLDAAAVIPVYAELVDFDGQDAVVYGLIGNDPEQDSYRRVELWVVARSDCQVLHFEQVDR